MMSCGEGLLPHYGCAAKVSTVSSLCHMAGLYYVCLAQTEHGKRRKINEFIG